MTSRNKEHVPKSPIEQSEYRSYIRNKDYEPTKEEGLNFDQTYKASVDYSLESDGNPRRLSVLDSIKEHFESNWISWLIGLVIVIIGFLAIDAKLVMGIHEERIETNKDDIGNNKGDIKSTNEKIDRIKESDYKQNLEIQENKLRIEFGKGSQSTDTINMKD